MLGRHHHPIDLEEKPKETLKSSEPSACTVGVATAGALAIGTFADIYQFKAGEEGIGDGKILGFIPNYVPGVTSIFAVLNLSYNVEFTAQGIKEMCGHTPPEWKKLGSGAKKAAIATSSFLNGYALFSDTISAAYFFKKSNWNIGLSYAVGGASALANIPTECRENFRRSCEAIKKITDRFGQTQEPVPEESKVEPTISYKEKTLNFLLDVFKFLIKFACAADDHLEAYVFVNAMFAVTAPTWQWVIFGFSFINFMNDYIFNGKNTADAVDKFRSNVEKGFPHFAKLASFLISAVLAAAVGDVKRNLVLSLLKDPDAPFPFPMPDTLKTAISIGAAIPTSINFAASFNNFICKVSQVIVNYYTEQKETSFSCEIIEEEDLAIVNPLDISDTPSIHSDTTDTRLSNASDLAGERSPESDEINETDYVVVSDDKSSPSESAPHGLLSAFSFLKQKALNTYSTVAPSQQLSLN